ncbi:hypothetical protein K491DRAFT_680656 [Lophiostoma macrostomum CBS 122681]|uniref:Uncharacterized protein n=1 Tax=Lophiostoma macrostomum CBS 122681 TaxID=1314788 RepID=A0A6A6T1R1_9PLEO|nr:hypothetical protein K491DRAFT_680656 [Lophiostoma macrostomum CBS 122681]
MLSFEDLEAVCYTTRGVTVLEDEQGPRTRSRTQGCGTSGRNPSRRRDSEVGSGESQGAGIRCAGCHQGAVLERECEDCVNMEGSHSLQEDQGDVEKNADQQGLIRGVKQSNVEGNGGARYWQRHDPRTAGAPGTRQHDGRGAQDMLQGSATPAAGSRCFSGVVEAAGCGEVKEVSPFRAWCSVLLSMLLSRNAAANASAGQTGDPISGGACCGGPQQRRRLDRRSGNLHHSVTSCWAGHCSVPASPQGCLDSRQSMMLLVRWVRRLQFPSLLDAGAIRSLPAMIAARRPMQQAPHGQFCSAQDVRGDQQPGCAAQTTQARSAISEEERGRHSTQRTADGGRQVLSKSAGVVRETGDAGCFVQPTQRRHTQASQQCRGPVSRCVSPNAAKPADGVVRLGRIHPNKSKEMSRSARTARCDSETDDDACSARRGYFDGIIGWMSRRFDGRHGWLA